MSGRELLRPPLAVAVLSALILCCSCALKAQSGKNSAPQPDLSGVWVIAGGGSSWDPNDPGGTKPDQLPMTAWALQRFSAARPPFGAKGTFDNPNDPVEKYCDPPGLTRMYTFPWQFSILQTSENVYMVFEYFHTWRLITMNQPHPKDVYPTWLGDSVGHYEGDTLVIDTIGLNDKSWLDNVGHPHSEALHTIERIRRLNAGTLQLDLTIEDPKAYTKSWTSHRTFQRSKFPLGETMCSLTEIEMFQKEVMEKTLPAKKK